MARQKLPGICAAVTGCMVLVSGIGVVAVSQSQTKADDPNTLTTSLQVLGPLLIICGVILLVCGFAYKYYIHQRLKKAQLRKEKYLVNRSPGDGSSQATSDTLSHMMEFDIEVGESSTDCPDLFNRSTEQVLPRQNHPGGAKPKRSKTTDESKIKNRHLKTGVENELYFHLHNDKGEEIEFGAGVYENQSPRSRSPHSKDLSRPKSPQTPDTSNKSHTDSIYTVEGNMHSNLSEVRNPAKLPPIKQLQTKGVKGKGKGKTNAARRTAAGNGQTRIHGDGNETSPAAAADPSKDITKDAGDRYTYSRRDTLALHEADDIEEIKDKMSSIIEDEDAESKKQSESPKLTYCRRGTLALHQEQDIEDISENKMASITEDEDIFDAVSDATAEKPVMTADINTRKTRVLTRGDTLALHAAEDVEDIPADDSTLQLQHGFNMHISTLQTHQELSDSD